MTDPLTYLATWSSLQNQLRFGPIAIYTWNPFDLCFDRKDHIFGGLWSKIEVIQVLVIYIIRVCLLGKAHIDPYCTGLAFNAAFDTP